jgi:ribonuclease D
MRKKAAGQEKKRVSDGGIEYRWIETEEALEDTLNTTFSGIYDTGLVAVDLEADSMYHFQERVCLLQMAVVDAVAIIDPLGIPDLSPLKPLFADPRIRKIFHGADYDVRSLYRDFGIEMENLFDTQIAARFLGFMQTGLESILSDFFDITLDKKYRKKDWSKRPLPPEMRNYAARDVAFLIPLAKELERRLKETGRLDWVTEECEQLRLVRPPAAADRPRFLNVRGAGRLSPRSLAVLEELLSFREAAGKEKDRPVFKIIGTTSLLKLAVAAPTTTEQLETTGALSKKQQDMYGYDVLGAVHRGLSVPEAQLPVYPRRKKPPLPQKTPERFQAVKQRRDRLAAQLSLDPSVILTKTAMTTIAAANPKTQEEMADLPELKRWQIHTFGGEILDALNTVSDPSQKTGGRRKRKRKKRATHKSL